MKLHSLTCPQCAQWLSPAPDTVVMACPRCTTAVALDDAGIKTLPVQFVAGKTENVEWYPFWTFEGQVELITRETQKGNKQSQAEQFWQQTHRFLIPAWNLDMWQARDLGLDFLQKPPQLSLLDEPPNAPFYPVTLTREDALKLIDFIVLTLEANRDDWLRDLQFRLGINVPALWLLPGTTAGKRWKLVN